MKQISSAICVKTHKCSKASAHLLISSFEFLWNPVQISTLIDSPPPGTMPENNQCLCKDIFSRILKKKQFCGLYSSDSEYFSCNFLFLYGLNVHLLQAQTVHSFFFFDLPVLCWTLEGEILNTDHCTILAVIYWRIQLYTCISINIDYTTSRMFQIKVVDIRYSIPLDIPFSSSTVEQIYNYWVEPHRSWR
jgi:hypothetical protein